MLWNSLTKEERENIESLRQQMNEAKSPREVKKIARQIHELIDEAERRIREFHQSRNEHAAAAQ